MGLIGTVRLAEVRKERLHLQKSPTARFVDVGNLPDSFTCPIAARTMSSPTAAQGSASVAAENLIHKLTCLFRNLDSRVAVMETGDHGFGDDPPERPHRTADRRVLSEGEMR